MNNTRRQHYIPQFIQRNFSADGKSIQFFDTKTNKKSNRPISESFMNLYLYKDDINSPKEPNKIEGDLAKYECEVAPLFRRINDAERSFELTKEEYESIKHFLNVMAYRSVNAKEQFIKSQSALYAFFQPNMDFEDLWKRNLGYLVNCRSLDEVKAHKNIDDVVKWIMARDGSGLFGVYLSVIRTGCEKEFILGDAYPTDISGVTDQNFNLPLYSIYPISPKKCLLAIHKHSENAGEDIIRLRKNIFIEPRENEVLNFHIRRAYDKEIDFINGEIANASQYGYITND